MTAAHALILSIALLALAVASLVFWRQGLVARVSEQLQTPSDSTRMDAIDMARLRARMAELRGEFGQDVALLMSNAAIEDLDRHLAILRRDTTPEGHETETQKFHRSLHSTVGIAATLGCTDLAGRSRTLDKLHDPAAENPAALHDLIADMQELRTKLAKLQAEDVPGSPAVSQKG